MTHIRPWLAIIRLGLVQAAIGALVVFATSTLNRVMVVEFALPALLPGTLVGLHYAVQVTRPRWGHGSDRGARRTPWIIGGMAALAVGVVLAAIATVELRQAPWPALGLAVLAYGLIGVGVGAAGTSLLVLLSQVAGPERRAEAATIAWMMMIAGFIATAAVAGHMLAPFSAGRLVETAAAIGAAAFVLTGVAVFGIEQRQGPAPVAARDNAVGFRTALAEVWAEPEARRFTLFVFLSMLAYSAQELVMEPFAGTVFALAPADSAKLAGLQHGGVLVGMMVVAVLGRVAARSRPGSMRLLTAGGCLASAAAALVVAGIGVTGAASALHGGVVMLGVANGAFSIAAVAGMMQLASQGRPGREGVRMGLWGAAQAVAFGCGGMSGTGASDLARTVLGSPALAYAAVLGSEALLFCAAATFALRAFPQGGTGTTWVRPEAPRAGRRRWAV